MVPDPVRPDPAAAIIRSSCATRLVQELGGLLGLKPDTNPDVVLKAAIEKFKPTTKPAGTALWQEDA